MDLLEYVASLAPEGETALIVRQRAIVRKGEPLRHADGSIKYTWPAFLPTHHRGAGEAWYVNTGSFIIDRFVEGKVSASSANAQFTLFLMLDDIGTKSKEPLLPPTWIVETSPGNFQWCYAYREDAQPTLGEQQAALVALAEAGYTDPGATNAVRNCRLPGSVNLKPQHDNFVCRLVSLNPEREYALDEICKAHGVTPAEADSGQRLQFRLRDTGSDTVLAWLNEHGMVRTAVNREGWLGIVCPNHTQHTDGNVEARYKPLDRSFCCYHGHCQDLDSRAFLAWVAENGGPTTTPGLRDELLAQHMAAAMGTLRPTQAYPDEAQKIVEEVERKEVGRVQKRDWYKRYAYVLSDDSYFDMETRTEYSRTAFNAIYRHVECKSIHGKRRVEASVCYDENRQEYGAPIVKGLIYAPGEGVLVAREGDVYGNRWVDARPKVASRKAQPTQWIDHCRALVPDERELAHCLDVMAFKVQNPRVKINHAVLHGGVEGCGKDTMWAPYIWSVCGPSLKNRGFLDNDTMNGQWGYHLESEILLLNELKEPEAVQRRALANRLKPIIAAPPETLQVNRKGKHPYETLNRLAVLAFTNDPVPISLPSQDRRWFCVWSHAGRMDAAAAAKLWRWYEHEEGYETVAAWLMARDVSAFNPAAAPPLTEWKMNMVEDGMSMSEGYLVEMIRGRKGEFAAGYVAAPLHSLVDRLQGSAPDGRKLHLQALLHALIEGGWRDLGRVASRAHPTKKRIFCAPDMLDHSLSDLRDLVEKLPEPTAVHLKLVK